MKKKRLFQLATALMLLSLIQLWGCADSQYQEVNDRPEMQGHGSRMGQGPPPGGMNNRNNVKKEEAVPEEAFAACEGKLAGETVYFTNARQEQIKATCKDIHDHLVAVPDGSKEKGNRNTP